MNPLYFTNHNNLITDSLTLIRPDDWHLHVRDGDLLKHVIAGSTRHIGRAIIMPNLKPPIVTTKLAQAYRQRILDTLHAQDHANRQFTPLMTLYLTPQTTQEEIYRAKQSGIVYAVKLYPAGATTNSDAGVTDVIKQCADTLEAMQACAMPLLVHSESTDPEVDIFDREAVFIEQVMQRVRRDFPALKIVMEHITTRHGVDFVRDSDGPIAATITPQHLLYNRNALFKGGLRPHNYCLPVLKRESHRQALVQAATSGNSRFFMGTDSAPHLQSAKQSDCGCAGCYSAPFALPLYASVFAAMHKLDCLEGFTSKHGPAFYGLAENTDTITLIKQPQTIPARLALNHDAIIPLAAGTTLAWQIQDT